MEKTIKISVKTILVFIYKNSLNIKQTPFYQLISLKLKTEKTKQCHFDLRKTLTFLCYWHAMQSEIATVSRDLSSASGRMKLARADDRYIWNIWLRIVFL